MKRLIGNFALIVGVLWGLLPACGRATEGGGTNYLPGFYGDFGMAVLPGPGTYFNNFLAVYTDRSQRSGTVLEMPGIIHISNTQILGGQYLAAVFPGLMGSWDNLGQNSRGRFGLSDSYVVPFGLSWKWQDVSVVAFEGIVAPTGYYQLNDVNMGRNVWTFDHILAMTFNLPAHTDLSLIFGYMNNLSNGATHYKTGDEFHFDYTAGYYFRDDMAIGITGSYYRQVTADTAPVGVALPVMGEAATFGPAFMYTPKIGDRDVNMSIKWLHEFNVSGRLPQDYWIWRVLVPF